MRSIEDHRAAERAADGVPVGAVVDGLPVTEAAPGVDPFVLLAQAHQAVAELQEADLSVLDRQWIARYAQSTDELMARVDAVAIGVAAEIQDRGHDRDLGFFSTKAWLRHHVRLSGPEAHARMQVVRMFELIPGWADAARRGEVGVEQTRLMARIAANPRVHVALMETWDRLLDDACVFPFDVFERRVRDFARLADPDGASSTADTCRERRDAFLAQNPDGSWRLSGRFGSLDGARLNEVFAHFVWAEFETDWAAARELAGDDATGADLPRNEAQRRGDAVLAIFLAAAHAPLERSGRVPTLNVLIDEATLEGAITGAAPDPSRYADMVCRTQNGDPIDTDEAAALALWATIRRVVHDGSGVVIDLGRRRRLFTGSARDAALILGTRCLWPGCDRPTRRCEVDHSLGWRAHGNTVPRNSGPMCKPHNLLKSARRFTTRREPDGSWIVYDADHDPIN